MPNHVRITLQCRATPAVLDAFAVAVQGIDAPFSFDRIIPMPPELQIVSSSAVRDAMHILNELGSGLEERPGDGLHELLKANGQAINRAGLYALAEMDVSFGSKSVRALVGLAEQAITNLQRYGCTDWYEWSLEHWGTKWDAYMVEFQRLAEDTLEYRFSTAWSLPEPVIEKLVTQYPDIQFDGQFEEEFGHFHGIINSGEIITYAIV